MKLNRAYSIIEIKEVDEDKRIISGIASTPTTDRMGDQVDPMGAKFKLPMPFLWQHDSRNPIGHVIKATPTKKGIKIVAQIAAKGVTEEIDRAWSLIKSLLVQGLSIGFRPIESEPLKDSDRFGRLFTEWEWLELSAVTIPANQEATITTVKSIDSQQLAAMGEGAGDEQTGAPGRQVKLETNKMTIKEQIKRFQGLRTEKSDAMAALMAKSGEKGETLPAEDKETYDGLAADVKEIDEHLARLKLLDEANQKTITPVEGSNAEDASASRQRQPTGVQRVQMLRKELPKGTSFTRMVAALAVSKGNRSDAANWAERWRDSTPEVEMVLRAPLDLIEKVAVDPGTTTNATNAEPLVQYNIMASEFVELLRPLTVIGRISGFRRVPFKIKVPRQTAGGAVNWVGETKVKPLTALAFDSLTLDHFKIAGIVPLSEELVRFSNPSAEDLVRTDLANAVAQFMDTEFMDPTKALAAGVSPASVTNGVTPVVATGTTAAAFRTDVRSLFANFHAANIPIGSSGHWLMKQGRALALSLMQNSLGQPEFPGITPQGGTLLGYPVVVSENVPATGGSPVDGDLIIFILAGEIMLADDGAVTIDVSREASLQMESTPDSPVTASTTLVSLWQHNLIAIKAERFINWLKRRTGVVQFIASAKYAE